MLASFSSLIEMLEVLPDERACREYLEGSVWVDGVPTCPYCKSKRHYELKESGNFNGLYKCGDCRKRYTVRIGTIFEGSHIPLRKWFIAIYIFTMHKKGISSHQLARDLGITQRSSWFLLQRLRGAITTKEAVSGEVQVDEMFIGGKNKNRHWDKKVKNSCGRSFKDKTPVFGMAYDGKVQCVVVPNTKAATIQPIIYEKVELGSTIYSDEWMAYKGIGAHYNHEVVDHGRGQYTNGKATTNAMEGFWSFLKRGLTGIYHRVTPRHLARYCDEFVFRYNTRKDTPQARFNFVLQNSQRLTYQMLIAKA